MKNYIIEFIGAFFLIFTIAMTGNPIAIGFVLTALLYMGGYVSGAHYNPAVTLAVLLTKNIKPITAFMYMLAQALGGLAAAVVFEIIAGSKFIPAPGVNSDIIQIIILEVIFTFLLCFVVLHTAVSSKTKGNQYFGLAIGLTVMAGAYAAGPISGGVFNPAVAAGPILFDQANLTANLNNMLLYIICPFVGSAIAALVYKVK